MTDAIATRDDTRARIVDAAAELLATGGSAAVTTRGVAEAAGVQAPTIYRLFGDKDGLLDAVAEHAMTTFAAAKASAVAAAVDTDPVEDLRSGWAMTIDFGLANPDLYVLLSDPRRGRRSTASKAGVRLLAERVHRVAAAGRLGVSERRAVDLVHAAGTGAVLAVLSQEPDERDAELPAAMLEAVLAQILTPAPVGQATVNPATVNPAAGNPAADGPADAGPVADGPAVDAGPGRAAVVTSAAVALRASSPDLDALSATERALLAEWLDRVIDAG